MLIQNSYERYQTPIGARIGGTISAPALDEIVTNYRAPLVTALTRVPEPR